jgi:hypothetical protein
MELTVVTTQNTELRSYWIEAISRLSGDFGVDSDRVERQVAQEIKRHGITTLLGHLRLCGAIPESYGHDSSEEKLYSKYTDVVIHEAYTAMGLTSVVLKERADVADVECVCADYGFVADAKAFRLSRTAKNQKDFKVQALDGWKHGKPFAMVVCPVYQLPSRNSQIYQQAAARSVCICTYTHLAVLVRYAESIGQSNAIGLLHHVFKVVEAMNPSKDAGAYWQVVNRAFLDAGRSIADIWREEKIASVESVRIAQLEALDYLALERERIMKLSRREAIREVLEWCKLDNRIQTVKSVKHNGLLELGITL